MKTSQEIRDEWRKLGEGYPGEHKAARAAFDVLAPLEDRGTVVGVRRRFPVYETSAGSPSVDSIWRLSVMISDAIARTMIQ